MQSFLLVLVGIGPVAAATAVQPPRWRCAERCPAVMAAFERACTSTGLERVPAPAGGAPVGRS